MGEIANVIPVIAKADTLTQKEMAAFKAQMLQDLQAHGIKIYPNSYCEDPEVIADLIVGSSSGARLCALLLINLAALTFSDLHSFRRHRFRQHCRVQGQAWPWS